MTTQTKCADSIAFALAMARLLDAIIPMYRPGPDLNILCLNIYDQRLLREMGISPGGEPRQ